MRLDGFETERGASSSPDVSVIPAIGVLSLLRHQPTSTLLARLARCDGNAPKVCLTRDERGKEIRKWGKDTRKGESRTLWSIRTCFHSVAKSSLWMELFQLSELLLLASGEKTLVASTQEEHEARKQAIGGNVSAWQDRRGERILQLGSDGRTRTTDTALGNK